MRSAADLLASSADGNISTRAICAAANVTAPTLYHHFQDKEALLEAVILEGFTRYLDEKRSVVHQPDAREAFRLGWDMHVSFGCEHPGHYRLMFCNPGAERVPPAALLARETLVRTITEWDRKGFLLVPVDVAAATTSAAAVGVTLQLIASRAESTDPISAGVRDTVARALFGPPSTDDERVSGVVRSARQLLDALPDGPATPLRTTETALLREWLNTISIPSNDRNEDTRDRNV
jgi:AcrR family transcriptional regulator